MIDIPKLTATINTEEVETVELPPIVATIETKENFVELPKVVADICSKNPIVGNLGTMVAGKGKDGKDGVDGCPGKDGIDGKPGRDGIDGKDGKDGIAPHIGDNGNWFIDDFDTGVCAVGKNGLDGAPGKDGYTPRLGIDYFNGKDGRDGVDGKTPVKGVDYFDGRDGKDGKDGKNGRTPIKGIDYRDGKDGKDGLSGLNGTDGFSPKVSVEEIEGGHKITITDKYGEKSFDVMDGQGGNGDGGTGENGFSPTISIEEIENGHRITITDIDGTKTIDVLNGKNGIDGKDGYTPIKGVDYFDGLPGADGKDGQPGADGISPVVSVEDIDGGHRVTITDKDGEKTFDVMDGKDGTGGGGGAQADWSVNDPEAAGYVKNRTHYETPPAFDIQWDGDMTGKFALDMSAFGYPQGYYFVKVSDIVPNVNDVVGGVLTSSYGDKSVASEANIDSASFPGAFVVYEAVVIVTDQSTLNGALGLPDGYVQNGTYFLFYDSFWVSSFTAKIELKKIDEKYLPETVATIQDLLGFFLYPYRIVLDVGGSEFIDTYYFEELNEEAKAEYRRHLENGSICRLELAVTGEVYDEGRGGVSLEEARFFVHRITDGYYQGAFVVWDNLARYLVCVSVRCHDTYELRVSAKPLN